MKIWITWAHSVWKSTLLEKLEWNKIREIARDLIKKLWVLPQDMNKEQLNNFQRDLIHKQIKEETLRWDSFIWDRTLIDILAYSKWLDIYNNLLDTVKSYLSEYPYDIIFYIPIEFPLEKDWVRFEDENYQKEIDNNIISILKELNIEYITVSWTVEDRLNLINNIINDFKKT